MSMAHVEACEQSENLERTSDLNLVAFFEPELLRISSGEAATSLLNSSIIKNLVRFEVLERSMLREKGNRNLVLTSKGLSLLKSP